ncbi:hypothetical protein FRACA_2830002 [Frankia canadensis]|uniref:Uncharacterized protein n=1 Tax=Frankia canadensis TaxID=1836972 RepID=A0A2I2KT41_9ACTN|nr:hypothetical protein FRACA_2830002 [Frankia canadensis]SOU56133.1 hypothetical protein FRACA_2830002 [Frankia canadensis]
MPLAERDLPTVRVAMVVRNQLGYRRGGHWVLPAARLQDDRFYTGVHPCRVVGLDPPVSRHFAGGAAGRGSGASSGRRRTLST